MFHSSRRTRLTKSAHSKWGQFCKKMHITKIARVSPQKSLTYSFFNAICVVITHFRWSLLKNYEDRAFQTLNSMSTMTLSSTPDALLVGAKGAVRESFTFEMILEAEAD